MSKFYHISFLFESGKHLTSELDIVFNKASDWIRYAPNCWIIYTSQSSEKWYNSIKKAIHEDDSFMILQIDPSTRNGWMPLDIWDWLDKERPSAKPIIKLSKND